MCDCGAPCSNKSGGPWPPITPLIVAPDVWTLKVLKPGRNRLVASGCGAEPCSAPAARALSCFSIVRRSMCSEFSICSPFCPSIFQQRHHVVAGQPVPALQCFKLDDETDGSHFSAEFLGQTHRSKTGSAGRQQIVGDHHSRAGFNGILVDLELIHTAFELVAVALGFRWKLVWFSHGNKAGPAFLR